MAYSLQENLLGRFFQRKAQTEAITGRKMSPQEVEAAIGAYFGQALGRQAELEGVAVQREQVELQKEQAKKETRAATVSGVAQAGTSFAMADYLYKGKLSGGIKSGIGKIGGLFAGEAAIGAGVAGGVTAGGTVAGGVGAGGAIAGGAGAGAATTGAATATTAAGATTLGAVASTAIPVIGLGIAAILGGKAIADSSVICTELCKQGYIDPYILMLDGLYRDCYVDDNTYNGYMSWAPSVVKLMQKSKIFTLLVAIPAKSWAINSASKMDKNIPSTLIGKILNKIGVPICRALGRRKEVFSWVS